MIQFCHNRKYDTFLGHDGYTLDGVISPRGGTTVAMEVPELWFVNTLKVGDFFEKRVGTARCSDDDNYSKKIGRDLAVSRMKQTRLTVVTVVSDIVILEDKSGALFGLRKGKNAVHFVEYDNG